MANSTESSIHYCSVISKVNGEDPIGTAGTADRWLLIEIETPWSANLWRENTILNAVFKYLKELEKTNSWAASLRVLAIAPDPEYSNPERIRIIDYKRPNRLFSQFEKQEYFVAQERIIPLIRALLTDPDELKAFGDDRQETAHVRELLICTHAEVDTACGQFGTPIYEKLRYQMIASAPLRIWKTCHFGGHKFAPTLIDFPHGHFWGHLEPEILETLVNHQGNVTQLRSFYRGWAGLGKFEQIAEREIWMHEGWDWLTYAKAGQVITRESPGMSWLRSLLRQIPIQQINKWIERSLPAPSIEVQIEFASPTGDYKGVYEARITVAGKVISTPKSGSKITLKAVPQYQVERCQLKQGNPA